MPYSIIEVDGVKVNSETKKFPVEVTAEQHAINGVQHTGILEDSQIPTSIMRTVNHQSDAHTMIIDGRDVSVDGAKLDTIETGAEVNNISDLAAQDLTSGGAISWHNHDGFYYRKTELQTSGQASVAWGNLTSVPSAFIPSEHSHDDRYYTETELNSGQLDSRYYTESEVTALLSGKSDNSHNHDDRYYTESEITVLLTGKSNIGHLHDDRYYTESEISSFLAGKSDLDHLHDGRYYTESELDSGQLDSRYYTESEVDGLVTAASVGVRGAVNTFADLPTSGVVSGQIYIVRQTVGANEEGFYRWNGSSWNFLVNNTGIETHNELSGINAGDYKHLTQSEYSELTSGSSCSIHFHDNRYYTESETDAKLALKSDLSHFHDDRYYTESEITVFLANKADSLHSHDDRYYTESELDSGQLDSRYYTESEINVFLATKSDVSHLHDDRYFTETEIDAKLALKSDSSHLHDDRYYTESETIVLLNSKSDLNHIHDDRYYTESEIAALLSEKSDVTHLHDNRYFTEAELSAITATSGATHIGIASIPGVSASTVQGALEEIKASSSSITLDGAYDNGRIISADAGAVKLDTGSATSAPLELTNKTSAPTTSLAAGQLAVINNTLYVYDGSRAKWLTPSKTFNAGKVGGTKNQYLRFPDSVSNSGFIGGKSGTIISCAITSTTTGSGASGMAAYLRVNGTTQATLVFNASGDALSTSLNIDFGATDVIQILMGNNIVDMQNCVATVEFCWRL